MSDLVLAVKGCYFDEIKAGIKPKEFRLANEYWRKRLIGRKYERLIITRGYPRSDDADRRMVFPYRGYEMEQRTHEHFGADEVTVFAIKLYEIEGEAP